MTNDNSQMHKHSQPAEMTAASVDQMQDGGQRLIFQDSDFYDLQLTRVDFNRCTWKNVRLKSLSLNECKLKRSRFTDSYLPQATFERCDLTGTIFERCYLRNATFDQTKLWYVEFNDCDLDYDNILASLPQEVNLRRRLLHNLRLNALARRDFKMANILLIKEMEARRLEDKSIVLGSSGYFKENFSSHDRFAAFFRLLGSSIEQVLWGYGARLSALLRSAAITVMFLATLIWIFDIPFSIGNDVTVGEVGFWEALYVAAVTFSTLGGVTPESGLARAVAIALSVAGPIFLGLFTAAAFRRIER